MLPVSELVLRNLSRLAGAHEVLLVNPPGDGLAAALVDHVPRLTCSTRHHGIARHLERNLAKAVEVRFEALPDRLHRGPALLLAPREKDLFEMQADALRAVVKNDSLWIAGEKRAGIRSAVRRLDSLFDRVELRDTARHGALFEARSPSPGPFVSDAYRSEWALPREVAPLSVVSYPGVFAHGGLDDGTRQLLATLDGLDLQGRVLDFACGAGVIGAVLKRSRPALELELCDHDALALEAARATLAKNGLEARVTASDGLAEVPGPFDWIVSNPPFHQGVRTDMSVAGRFIADAVGRLKPGGRLVLVANRHLPYRRWLEQAFGNHQELAGSGRFMVLAARRPNT